MSGYRISIVCTGRGQHRAEELGTEVAQPDGWRLEWNGRTATTSTPDGPVLIRTATAGRYRTPEGDPAPGLRVWSDPRVAPLRQFRCPACPRFPQIRIDDWFKALDTYREAGHTQLDVSRLPF